MKKLIAVALTIIALAMTGCGSKSIDESMFGNYFGSYADVGTEYMRETFEDYPALQEYYAGEDKDTEVTLTVNRDRTWEAKIGFDRYSGRWKPVGSEGLEMEFLVEKGADLRDYDWTFRKSGRSYVFKFYDWVSYNVQMTKVN